MDTLVRRISHKREGDENVLPEIHGHSGGFSESDGMDIVRLVMNQRVRA